MKKGLPALLKKYFKISDSNSLYGILPTRYTSTGIHAFAEIGVSIDVKNMGFIQLLRHGKQKYFSQYTVPFGANLMRG